MIPASVDTPFHRLILAVNCFITTGDHIGEGVICPDGDGRVHVTIPVHRDMPLDQSDLERLRERVQDLADQFGCELCLIGGDARFERWALFLPEGRMESFARELRRVPGRLGWGSPKPYVDEYERQLRAVARRSGRVH